jgi:hypothetical protein
MKRLLDSDLFVPSVILSLTTSFLLVWAIATL